MPRRPMRPVNRWQLMMLLTLSAPADDWFTPCENTVTTRSVAPNMAKNFSTAPASRPQACAVAAISMLAARAACNAASASRVCAPTNAVLVCPWSASQASRPLNSMTSLPLRNGRCRSAPSEVAVRRGSMTTSLSGPALALGLDALHHHRMAPGEIGTHDHQQVRRFEILVVDGHHVLAECAHVACHCGRHAQARIGVDVRGADVALHELVGDVVVLGQQLSGDIQRHGLRAVGIDAVLQSRGDGIQRDRPALPAPRPPPGAATCPHRPASPPVPCPWNTGGRDWLGAPDLRVRKCRPSIALCQNSAADTTVRDRSSASLWSCDGPCRRLRSEQQRLAQHTRHRAAVRSAPRTSRNCACRRTAPPPAGDCP